MRQLRIHPTMHILYLTAQQEDVHLKRFEEGIRTVVGILTEPVGE